MLFVWLFSKERVQRKVIQLSTGNEFPIIPLVSSYGIKATVIVEQLLNPWSTNFPHRNIILCFFKEDFKNT